MWTAMGFQGWYMYIVKACVNHIEHLQVVL